MKFNDNPDFVKKAIFTQSENPVDDNRRDFRFVFLSFKLSVFILQFPRQDFLNEY